MKKFIRIGVDLAKNYFQIHALAHEGAPAVTRKMTRVKMREFFSQIEPCLVGMEACSTAHYWARELKAMGHEVLLMPPVSLHPSAFIARPAVPRTWRHHPAASRSLHQAKRTRPCGASARQPVTLTGAPLGPVQAAKSAISSAPEFRAQTLLFFNILYLERNC